MKTQKYKWLRFYELLRGEGFFLGVARAQKANTFFAWKGGIRVFVSPFRKVRSMRPHGPVAPSIVGRIVRVLAANAPYLDILKSDGVKTELVAGEEQRPRE